jgi:hypothetical protein
MSTAKHRLEETLDLPTPQQLQQIVNSASHAHERLKLPHNAASFEQAMERAFPGGFTHRDEANALIAMAVRNGPLENLHAGKYSALLEDDALSRVTDYEMRILMINATRMLAILLQMRDQSPDTYRDFVQSYGNMYCLSWERKVS